MRTLRDEEVKELFYSVQHGMHPSTAMKKYLELKDHIVDVNKKDGPSELSPPQLKDDECSRCGCLRSSHPVLPVCHEFEESR